MSPASTLSKQRLQNLLPDLGPDHLAELLEVVATERFTIQREPETALVMMSVNDCFDVAFHLGEVLVTRAEVACDDHVGWGMAMGDAPEAALLLACADAAAASDDAALQTTLESRIAVLAERIAPKRTAEQTMAATTRVAFESMPEG